MVYVRTNVLDIISRTPIVQSQFYHYDKFELYNLANDPSERHNLAKTNPSVAKRLRAKLAAWQKLMEAKMPSPNTNYDPNA